MLIIAEKINIMSKTIGPAMRNREAKPIHDMALAQIQGGARALDLNLGPATKDQIELGLNAKALPPAQRLKAQAPGGMCQYKVRIASAHEVDAELEGWLRAAFDAAG